MFPTARQRSSRLRALRRRKCALSLANAIFDRVEVRGVWRQEQQPVSLRLQKGLRCFGFVGGKGCRGSQCPRAPGWVPIGFRCKCRRSRGSWPHRSPMARSAHCNAAPRRTSDCPSDRRAHRPAICRRAARAPAAGSSWSSWMSRPERPAGAVPGASGAGADGSEHGAHAAPGRVRTPPQATTFLYENPSFMRRRDKQDGSARTPCSTSRSSARSGMVMTGRASTVRTRWPLGGVSCPPGGRP